MITVHTIPGSPYGRAALIACIEKNAPYRLAPLPPGGIRQPAHLARHPFGRIPAIEDDGFSLYETQAIIRYIDAAYGAPGALTPSDPKAAARMNQAIGVVDCYVFADNGAKTLVFNRVVGPKFGMPCNEEAVAASLPAARRAVEVMAGYLEDSPYVAGATLTLADVHAGPQIDLLSECDEGAAMIEGTPLAGWLERLRARPSFAATTWPRLAEAAAAVAA